MHLEGTESPPRTPIARAWRATSAREVYKGLDVQRGHLVVKYHPGDFTGSRVPALYVLYFPSASTHPDSLRRHPVVSHRPHVVDLVFTCEGVRASPHTSLAQARRGAHQYLKSVGRRRGTSLAS